MPSGWSPASKLNWSNAVEQPLFNLHRQNEGITEKENICNGIYILNVVCFGFNAAKDCRVWEGKIMLRHMKRIQKLTKHSRFKDLCRGTVVCQGVHIL